MALKITPSRYLKNVRRFGVVTQNVPKNGQDQCKPIELKKVPIPTRDKLKDAKRIMVKFGSAVIMQKGKQIAMSRLANLIEQVIVTFLSVSVWCNVGCLQMATLHQEGKEIVFITSGSVAHGRSQISTKVHVISKTTFYWSVFSFFFNSGGDEVSG